MKYNQYYRSPPSSAYFLRLRTNAFTKADRDVARLVSACNPFHARAALIANPCSVLVSSHLGRWSWPADVALVSRCDTWSRVVTHVADGFRAPFDIHGFEHVRTVMLSHHLLYSQPPQRRERGSNMLAASETGD